MGQNHERARASSDNGSTPVLQTVRWEFESPEVHHYWRVAERYSGWLLTRRSQVRSLPLQPIRRHRLMAGPDPLKVATRGQYPLAVPIRPRGRMEKTPVYETGGRWFKSSRDYQFAQWILFV